MYRVFSEKSSVFVDAVTLIVYSLHVTKPRYSKAYQRNYSMLDWNACAYFLNHLWIKDLDTAGGEPKVVQKEKSSLDDSGM